MKSLYRYVKKINIFIGLLIILLIPLLTQASSFAPTVIQKDLVPNTNIAVTYTFPMAPPQTIKLYAWIGDPTKDFSQWNRNNYLGQISATDTPPFEFTKVWDISSLDSSKTYAYAFADGSGTNAVLFNKSGSANGFNCFTMSIDSVPCFPTTTTPSTNTTPAPTPTPAPTSNSNTVTNPTGGSGIPGSIGVEESPTLVGVLKIVFPPEQQIITQTTAEIHGILSSILITPVNLTAVSGPDGSPLGNEQPIISISYPGLAPGEQKPITLSFSGLTPGQTYSFAFKNGGVTSPARSFTTPNGTTIMNPVFAGNVLGVNENPGGLDPVVDTISDKGIVPKCGRTAGEGVSNKETRMCGYEDFIQLISNVIQYAVIIIGPIMGIFIIYSGFMIIWLGKDGDPTAEVMVQLKKHKQRMIKIAIGIAIMMSSYLIVMMIINELGVKPEYTLIDIIS